MESKCLNILLIHPEVARTKYDFAGIIEDECLDLEYLFTLLTNQGHRVELFDLQVEKGTVAHKIQQFDPDVVYLWGKVKQENFMLEYCQAAKAHNADTITIIGGLHAQLCYERMYRDYVDYIHTSYDIYKVLDVLAYHFGDSDVTPDCIQGICYRNGDVWVKNESCAFDINRLPRPDRTYFDQHPNNYGYLDMKHAACVRTSYCCPYRCAFCMRNKMNMGQYVCRDMADVVDEIAHIQAENIYFVDDDFLFDTDRLNTFIRLVKERNIHKKYICFGRSDFVAANEEMMMRLREIGLHYVLVGLETICDDRLKGYNKRSSMDNNVRSIEICNRLGLQIMGMFILDLDYTPKDFRHLYRWIKRHDIRHVAVSIYLPEMGTETYEAYKDRLITDNPSHWDYLHVVAKPDHMSVKRYYFHYYVLLIKLFFKGYREKVYDFIDYKDYVWTFIKSIFKTKRPNDDA